MKYLSALEPLEARIAPAVAIVNHPFDIVAGLGQTSATVDLAKMVDADVDSFRTQVAFTFNFKLPNAEDNAKIVIELFDDKAPVSVQNFLSYVNGLAGTDYDGTFIHRAGELNSGHAGADIIQGGGFDISNFFKHIPTATTVHNEYNANDPEVQNTRGTLAMAKTGIGPHTGSSEWFFNLTDNATVLDGSNNGGFTVFGKIIQGIEVADAIGAANQANLGGALSTLPVHDYTSGKVSPGQVFQIVEAKVIGPVADDLNGHSFGDIAVTVPGTDTTSQLVTPKVVGHELLLKFTPGKTGQAEITIPVMKDGETVEEKFLITVKPNLLSEVTTHKLAQTFVAGDQGVAKVKVTNNSAGDANGNVTVRLYLSEVKSDANGDGLPDQPTFIKDAADVLMGEMTLPVDLSSGESKTVSVPYLVKDTGNGVALIGGKTYLVLAEVVPAAGASIDELFSDDNTGPRLTGHTYQQGFGDLAGRNNAVATIETPTGLLTFKLAGSGSGSFTRDADGGIDIRLTGTNNGSVLTVKAASGTAHIDDIALTSFMGTVKLPNVTLHGDFTAESGVKNVILGTLGSATSGVDKSFSVNGLPGGTQKMNATFGQVWDYSFTSFQPVGKLSAASWLDSANTSEDQIFVTQLDSLRVTGDLETNVVVSTDEGKAGQIAVGGTLRNAAVKTFGDINAISIGNITGSTILAGLNATPDDVADFASARAIGRMTVKGMIADSTIAAASFNSVKIGNMAGSAILAGVAGKPDALADFATTSEIGSFTIAGTLSDSIVAAARFKTIVLASVDKEAGSEVKGIYADAIKSYVRKGLLPTKLTKLDATGTFDADHNYEVRVF